MINKKYLPVDVYKLIKDKEIKPNNIGMSKSQIYEIKDKKDPKNGYFLKINEPEIGYRLYNTYAVLNWIDDKLPVPKVLVYTKKGRKEFLLQEKIDGEVSFSDYFYPIRDNILKLLAEGLQNIHTLEHSDFPKNLVYDNNKLLEIANQRLKNGLVEKETFDFKWQHKNEYQLLKELEEKSKEIKEELVFSHGDYCLPNIMIDNNKISGYVDWIHGGVYDRNYDLAAVIWSITWNFGEKYVQTFLDYYGNEYVDWQKIRYYQQLNSFL